MEGILNTNVKRIIFEGRGIRDKKQNGKVYPGVYIENDTKICEADVKFNTWLEEVQSSLNEVVKKKNEDIKKKISIEKMKKEDNSNKLEKLEEKQEDLKEWNIMLDIISVQSNENYGHTKRIEVVYKIVEYYKD